MSTVQSHGFTSETSRSTEWAAGGSIAEAVVGLAAVVLTIIGLAGVTPSYIVPIAAICVGAALAFEGSAMRNEVGMSAGFFGGLTGILLGILALVGVVPEVLTAVAVIVLSCSLMVGCCSVAESGVGHDTANFAAGGMHVVCGLAGLILGILALSHGTAMLALVGLFVLSCAVAFTGTATSARLSRMFSASWWHTRRV